MKRIAVSDLSIPFINQINFYGVCSFPVTENTLLKFTHYPGDGVTGARAGIIMGFAVSGLFGRVEKKYHYLNEK